MTELELMGDVASGKTMTEIAKKHCCSFSVVKRLCGVHGLKPKKGSRGGHNKKDMKGQRCGNLLVLEAGDPHPRHKLAMWKCQCVCGNICNCVGSDLRSGKTRTCGCRAGVESRRNWQGYGEIPRSKWRCIGQNARQRGIDVDLTIKQLDSLYKKQDHKCALSGLPLNMNIKNGTASLDRIDSSRGYALGNVQWVHKDVNKLKGIFSVEKLVFLCEKIVEEQNVTTRPRKKRIDSSTTLDD